MGKIRVGAVSYLNTKPLLYGIKNHPVSKDIELLEDYPAKVAQMLADGKIDVGLIPVAAVPKIAGAQIITDYCIGSEGPVASVCLFSESPIEQVEKVLLDYQSRTSVALAKILLKEFWKQDVDFIAATGEEYREAIKDTTAGVVIGDRALQQRQRSKYIFDLGEAWTTHTGLPFVFAAWITNKELPEEFIQQFNEANGSGLEAIDEVVRQNPYPYYNLDQYFKRNISYSLTTSKKEGMSLFLKKLQAHNL